MLRAPTSPITVQANHSIGVPRNMRSDLLCDVSYRPRLRHKLHHATPRCAALHSIALLRTSLQYSAPPNIILHHSSSWHISKCFLFITESYHYFYIIKMKTLTTKRNRSQKSVVSQQIQRLNQLTFSLL